MYENIIAILQAWWRLGYFDVAVAVSFTVAGVGALAVGLYFALRLVYWIVGSILLWMLRACSHYIRGRAMRKRAQLKEETRSLVADIMTSGLEDAVWHNKIDPKQATAIYRMVSRLGFWDCCERHFPSPPPDPTDLKEMILQRSPHLRKLIAAKKNGVVSETTTVTTTVRTLSPEAQEIERMLFA